MNSRLGFFCFVVSAAHANTGPDRSEACSENNCDGEETTLMSVQLLQTDRHISKTKSDSEHFVGVKRDFSDLLKHESKQKENHEKSHKGTHQVQQPEGSGIGDAVSGVGDAVGGAMDDVHSALPGGVEVIVGGGAGEVGGVGVNADDDIYAFLSALMANVVTIIGCVCIFMVLRNRYPMIYSNNVVGLDKCAPMTPADTTFGWASAAWFTPTKESAAGIGLDNAMLLEFCNMCMKILMIIGIPLVCIEGPLNMFFGGNAAGLDYMSYLSFGNVARLHPWLYYVHACFVWFVVITVQVQIYSAQREFLKLRYGWLNSLPDTRANTLLVEGIPEKQRSDTKLKSFFEKMMGAGTVQSAYCVKDTTTLAKQVADKVSLENALEVLGDDRSKASQIETDIAKLKVDIDESRKKVRDDAKDTTYTNDAGEQVPNPVNLSKAFVTFKQARTAQIALNLQFDSDSSVWVCSVPPEPRDLLWSDLVADPTVQAMRDVIGYALVVGLYFAYMPLVIGISNLAAAADMGPLQSLWEGLAPTLGLQFMVAFLPTILLLIFRSFFILKADAWSQTRLQKWYFWFQIVFVILVTAIGDSVVEFTTTIFVDPLAVFEMLAETMPHSTHFYMNFLVLQWTTHAMNLLRYVPLGKFRAFQAVYEEEEARAKAEPEDQDYYGLGSRSARFTINMVIGIVYSTLSPTIALLAWVNFACCRLFYGYLIPFAETKKPDLGGVFWVTKLEHLFIGNVIYCVLMTGVLFGRAPNAIPCLIAAPSIFWVVWSLGRFKQAFSWENLPFEQVAEQVEVKKRTMVGQYVQPELTDK